MFQKKTNARHSEKHFNGFSFLTKCLICFRDRVTRFRQTGAELIFIAIWLTKFWPFILVKKVHILAKNSGTPCFPLRPHVFHQTTCFPQDPAFSTTQDPIRRDPAPRDPGSAFSTYPSWSEIFTFNNRKMLTFDLLIIKGDTSRLLFAIYS